jgi:hypothetical protein
LLCNVSKFRCSVVEGINYGTEQIIKTNTQTMNQIILSTMAAAVIALAGCKTNKQDSCSTACAVKAEPVAVVAPVAATPAATATAPKVVRIKAGVSEPLTDGAGNVWLADQGFEGGDVIERPDLEIANTKSPEIYRAERYAMDSFTYKLPNGKYQVKLHFAETFEGITGPDERVFTFTVEGREFKDFDIFKKAGGSQRAYVESVNVDIADGKLDIKFIGNLENPAINGIEIIPAS